LRWPDSAADFFLEQPSSLNSPTTWTRIVATPAHEGAENVLSLNVGAESRYFRLRTPTLIDGDNDGIPDDIEPLLGLDPHKADTNQNGILDGDEDPDGDGLKTRWEVRYGYDPLARDTDGNGVADGLEDPDN